MQQKKHADQQPELSRNTTVRASIKIIDLKKHIEQVKQQRFSFNEKLLANIQSKGLFNAEVYKKVRIDCKHICLPNFIEL